MKIDYLKEIFIENDSIIRQKGKTTALIEACKKINGIFITYSYDQAKALKSQHKGVDIVSPSNLRLIGNTKPMIFDHYLLRLMLTKGYVDLKSKSTVELEKVFDLVKKELLYRTVELAKIGEGIES